MTVADLIRELEDFPRSWEVHLDVSAGDDGWEGDRVVRYVAGVREQSGMHGAVAIDASKEGVR